MNRLLTLVTFLAGSLSAKKAELLETKESQDTTKTLMTDEVSGSNTKLIYTFKTILEKYSDETNKYYLQATMTLKGLNTVNFVDAKDSIRMSVGWRNPQEDAYDVHSFDITYDNDPEKCVVDPLDGYCFGSVPTTQISTDANADLIYTGNDLNERHTWVSYKIDGVYTGYDQNGRHNSTIKQWTDFKDPQTENVGTEAVPDNKVKNYRSYEAFNDIEIISKVITPRPNKVSVSGSEVLQDFTVTYKKPFKPSGLTDINLKTMKFYNLTSAWGCYKTDAVTNAVGSDPDALYTPAVAADAAAGTAAVPGIGCKGTWQSIQNNLVYTNYADKVENFIVAEREYKDDRNRVVTES